MKNVIKGLAAAFRRPAPAVGTTPADVVHQENKWRLLRYRSSVRRHGTPILLVPSLINRHYVLDLLPGRSFSEHLVGAGHDVFTIDWGTPGPEDRFLDFDTITDRYLGRAVRKAARMAGAEGVHLVGYCLGGTLAAIYAAARPEKVASLTGIAAPIAFHDDGLLSAWSRTESLDLDALTEATGNVPWQLMQSAFHLLRPTLSMAKAVQLIDKAWDDEFLDGYFALETWGNDNVAFPGACYRRYIEELYRNDALVRGEFTLSGTPARLESIRCPTLAVTFQHDNIVPGASAAILLERVGSADKEQIHLSGGHVGGMVSRKAAEKLWPRLDRWWAARSAPLPSEVAAKAGRGTVKHAPVFGRAQAEPK